MRITDILNNGRVNISCELFPPKHGTQLDGFRPLVADIAKLSPSYMSVTYGASGGVSGYTADVADEIQNKNNVTALAHLSCLPNTREAIHTMVDKLRSIGVENILALRGDRPRDNSIELPGVFHYASELVSEIKGLGDFCVGGACYPESHPESKNVREDIEALKIKIDAGCDFLTTQMFFDNNIYYNFMYKALKAGINVPVVAGIMPVTSGSQIPNIIRLSGNNLPVRFLHICDCFGENPAAMEQAGIAYATEQIIDLIANGVKNIHIYTMNKPQVAGRIFENLSCIRDR